MTIHYSRSEQKGADQTALVCRLICNFVVHIHNTGFLIMKLKHKRFSQYEKTCLQGFKVQPKYTKLDLETFKFCMDKLQNNKILYYFVLHCS